MNDVQKALKARYPDLHPLIFQRALEKAETDVELFDILDTLPEYPFVWDDEQRRFVHKKDFLQLDSENKV